MKRVLAIAVSIVVLTLAILFLGSIEDTTPPVTPMNDNDPPPQPAVSATSPVPPTTVISAGLTIKGFPIHLDPNGNLLPGPEIRALFDALAREQGQIPADLWKSTILERYREALGDKAYQQLSTLLNRYIEYNLALQLLPMDGVASLADVLDHIRRIRRDYMGDATAPMFRDWQQVENFSRQFVEQVSGPDPDIQQLQRNLQEQVYALPVSVQPRAQQVLDQSQDLLTALSASAQGEPEIIRSIAEQLAAQALIQPDFTFGEPTAEFMAQYQEYITAKQQLLQQGNIRGEDDPALAALRQRYFSASDLLRVKTLDRAEMY